MHSLQSSQWATNRQRLIRLKGSIQTYDWGKKGSSSLVARLAKNAIGQEFIIDENKSYAEVWMGTHPNGPAHIYEQPETDLLSVIKSNPEHYLGQALIEEWPNTLQVPYLFKVLSIREALPLQAHPDVRLAQKLNKENEKEFVDANHKPEIAIAIGETLGHGTWGEDIAFTGFVGFKPLKDIQYSLETVEELRDAIGNQSLIQAFLTHPSQSTLKDVFGSLLTRGANDPDSVKSHISALLRKVQAIPGESISERALSKDTTNLLEKINNQYPGDVGIFATAFFMNFVKLKKGEAVYIGADEIHAYLEGDIIEYMATSDNVLNAAFAPRFETRRHLPTFVEMLTYTPRGPSHWSLPCEVYPQSKMQLTRSYNPPLKEFVVLHTSLRSEKGEEEILKAVTGPMIGLVTQGSCTLRATAGSGCQEIALDMGCIIYVAPGTELRARLIDEESEGQAEIWWAASVGK